MDETLAEILGAVERVGARRVVINSLSRFETALAPAFQEDFRESLYRRVGALTAVGATVLMTDGVVQGYPEVRFTADRVSFVTDAIVVQRYVEMRGELRKILTGRASVPVLRRGGWTMARVLTRAFIPPAG